MSLDKTYRLRCDITSLLMDRVMAISADNDDYRDRLKAGREDRHAKQTFCSSFSVPEDSSPRARRTAKDQGWIRHKEERPIYPGSDTMTTVAYDLCGGCKPIAAQR